MSAGGRSHPPGAPRASPRLRARRVGPGPALVLCAATLLSSPPALRAQQPYRIGPPPSWVRPVRADLTPTPLERFVTGGEEILLLDRQESIGGAAPERFRHIAYRLLDEGAIEEHSQIELSFDPTYERLTLHAVSVTRDGRSVDQLRPARIRVVRRESAMDDHVFDGSRSLVLVLEDVRKGDVVEYSYTRRGANPVFAGHYMAEVAFEQSVPVRELVFRLLWPGARPLYVRRLGPVPEPVVTTAGDRREYLWRVSQVPAKLLDADLPGWYDPFAEIQLSDFGTWTEVAAWGAGLFSDPGPLPGTLRTRLSRIRAEHPSREAQAQAALRFVQDEVRYVGVEIGVNSHTPYPVATVLRRGYGDCKDKALLLIAMLRELGFPARPALVSTSYRDHLREVHPTAAYFDHAIVRAEVEGRAYWLDPSALYQRGDLRSLAPRLGAALELAPATDSLSPIIPVPATVPATEIAVTFGLGAIGVPATMEVDTRYRGRAADRMRATTRDVTLAGLEREYTEFYAEAYPGIRSTALPRITDDEAANEVRTVERYEIPGFWHPAERGQGHVGTFDPLELEQAVPTPGTAGRTMPLAVGHPIHYRYAITAHLPGGWAIAPEADTITTPAVRFVRAIAAEGETLTLRYEYESLADYVPPAAAADHMEKLSRARRLLPLSVTPPDTSARAGTWRDPRQMNWPVLLTALLAAGLAVFGAIQLQRSPAPAWPRGPEGPGDGPTGLRGWLVVVGIGVTVTPVALLTSLARSAPVYTASAWALRTTPGGADYHPLWAPTLLLELVGNLVLLVFGCLLVWQFYRRRRWFPALFVIIAAARALFQAADALLAGAIPAVQAQGSEEGRTVSQVLVLALWVLYMFRSRRVKHTFVN